MNANERGYPKTELPRRLAAQLLRIFHDGRDLLINQP